MLKTVLDFGANPQGGSNYDAFCRARDAHALIVPPGRYHFDRPFDPSLAGPNWQLIGFGGPYNAMLVPLGDHPVIEVTEQSRFTMQGITAFGGEAVNPAHTAPLIWIRNAGISSLTDVWAQYANADAIVIGDPSKPALSAIHLTRVVSQFAGKAITRYDTIDPVPADFVGRGIVIQNCNQWTAKECATEYARGGGFYVRGSNSVDNNGLIEGLRSEGNNQYAAHLTGCDRMVVRNSYLYSSPLDIVGCTDRTVEYENTFYDSYTNRR